MNTATESPKQFRVRQCDSCKARNIITVPSADNASIPACPKCGEHPGVISSYADCPHNPVHAWYERAACIKAQAKTRKRPKQVFHTGEIPHLWAHEVQSSAHNPQRNLFFENGTIYSYGSHFPIASHVESKGHKAVLLTTRKYSITTSGHKSATRGAIPKNVLVFEVPNVVLDWNVKERHALNVKSYIEELTHSITKETKARSLWRKQSQHSESNFLREKLFAYAKFFGLKRPAKVPEVPKLTAAQIRKIKEREKFLASPEHQGVVLYARARREMAQDFAKRRAASEAIAEWRAGNPYARVPYGLPTMLRIKDDEVETSMGARVPIDHAKRVLAIVRRLVSEGRSFEANGHTIPVGVYHVDRIDASGTIHAGCHHIAFPEIERIAPAIEAWSA